MKLPRDLSGAELTKHLRTYGYVVTRQTGSHMRLTSRLRESEHHVTVPAHRALAVGTLASIIGDVAAYLGTSREALAEELFG